VISFNLDTFPFDPPETDSAMLPKSPTNPEAQAAIFVLGMHDIQQLAQESRSPEYRDDDDEHTQDLGQIESSPEPPAHLSLVDAALGLFLIVSVEKI
jgi:hypothetical protein